MKITIGKKIVYLIYGLGIGAAIIASGYCFYINYQKNEIKSFETVAKLEVSPTIIPTATPTQIPSPTLKPTLKPTTKPTVVNLPINNNPLSSGQSKQVVKTDQGDFTVNIISADLSNTKVVVDTASDGDCKNDCPVKSLSEFASRSGAYAAINGPYFCPASYPACVDKKNSFDTLLMNKNKTYFNSDNNIYSSNPVTIFSTNSRFVEKGSEWGRDTSVDSVIMGRPLLVFNGEVKFGGNDDNKESSKGNRSFIGASGNTVYIGVVYSATVAQAAKTIAAMGIKNAINLDSGGSNALYYNGKYLTGPGRDTPFGILLVRR